MWIKSFERKDDGSHVDEFAVSWLRIFKPYVVLDKSIQASVLQEFGYFNYAERQVCEKYWTRERMAQNDLDDETILALHFVDFMDWEVSPAIVMNIHKVDPVLKNRFGVQCANVAQNSYNCAFRFECTECGVGASRETCKHQVTSQSSKFLSGVDHTQDISKESPSPRYLYLWDVKDGLLSAFYNETGRNSALKDKNLF